MNFESICQERLHEESLLEIYWEFIRKADQMLSEMSRQECLGKMPARENFSNSLRFYMKASSATLGVQCAPFCLSGIQSRLSLSLNYS